MTIEEMQLNTNAQNGARILQSVFPNIVFTSGRRDRNSQARAMATNVLVNRRWIEQTYLPSQIRDELQAWVNEALGADTIFEIAQGLLSVMDRFGDSQLRHLSKHLSGDAFDIQPVTMGAEGMLAAIRTLPHLDKFLQKEGGLTRWHCQFYSDTEA